MASAAFVAGRDRVQPETFETEAQFSDLPYETWLRIRVKFHLSDRELAIVQGVCRNWDETTIASTMAISRDIVYRTVQRIYVKLHIGSRIELRARMRSESLNPEVQLDDHRSSIPPKNASQPGRKGWTKRHALKAS
jgi:DNA-binding NarL/FixJ family response regulator